MGDCEFMHAKEKVTACVWSCTLMCLCERQTERGQRSVWQKAFVVKVAILNLLLVLDGSTSLCPCLFVWPSFSLSLHLYDDSVYSVGLLTIYGKHHHDSSRRGTAYRWKEFLSQGQAMMILFVLWELNQWLCMFKPVRYKSHFCPKHFSTRTILKVLFFVHSKMLWYADSEIRKKELEMMYQYRAHSQTSLKSQMLECLWTPEIKISWKKVVQNSKSILWLVDFLLFIN